MLSDFEAFEFALRVMADKPPKACDAAYLFGQTKDNETSVLNKGSELYYGGVAKQLALTALGEESGYPGFIEWKGALGKLGIGDNTIIPIPRTSELISNTFTEAVEFVRYAKEVGWKSVICVAPAFHLPRAFLGMVTALNAEYPELLAYAQCGAGLPWGASAVHSQGTTEGTRAELVKGEFDRIRKYDNLSHPSIAVEYLNAR